MVTKKIIGTFVCLLCLTVLVIGISSEATAETLKGKGVSAVSKIERLPVGDTENHNIGLTAREGMILFENGEVATTKAMAMWDMIGPASGWAKGYVQFIFLDGSTIHSNFHQQILPPTGGEAIQYDSKITGDIVKGTGKYEGVKGTFTTSSKQIKAEKGEPAGKLISDVVINYSK